MIDKNLRPRFEVSINYFRVAILMVMCFATTTFYGCDSSMMRLMFSFNVKLIVTVVDDDTSLPIPDVDVEIVKHEGFGGQAKEHQKSGPDGHITIHDKEEFLGPYLQQVNVKKEGYHNNGANTGDLYVDYWRQDQSRKLKKKIIIRLKKIVNPTQLTHVAGTFHEGDNAALLSNIHLYKVDNRSTKLICEPSLHKHAEDADFELTDIHMEYRKNESRVYKGVAKIRFFGAGGIQEIPNYEDTEQSFMGWYMRFYGLGNVILAPNEGYSRELIIVSERQYIAKLRDGEHYFKFTPLIFSAVTTTRLVNPATIGNVPAYAKLGIFLQPEANRNLETTDVITSPW